GIRDATVTGVQTCALPISVPADRRAEGLLPLGDRVGTRDLPPAGRGDGLYPAGRNPTGLGYAVFLRGQPPSNHLVLVGCRCAFLWHHLNKSRCGAYTAAALASRFK